MIYTQAVILEILRIASPVPATVRCNAYEDMCVEGTKLPQVKTTCRCISTFTIGLFKLQFGSVILIFKGTMFMVNVFGIHRSDRIWEDGEVFRPERFLNERGDELVNTEKIIPFGYGNKTKYDSGVLKAFLPISVLVSALTAQWW